MNAVSLTSMPCPTCGGQMVQDDRIGGAVCAYCLWLKVLPQERPDTETRRVVRAFLAQMEGTR